MSRVGAPPSSSSSSSENGTAKNPEDFLSLEKKASSKSRLCRVLVFGLLLYIVTISLHLSIAGHYLGMRECHRGLAQDIEDFKLADFVNLNNSDSGEGGLEETEDQSLTEMLEGFVNERLYFKVRNKLINLAPEHWVQKVLAIVSFQLSKYKPSQIAEYCSFNGQKFESAFEIGAYICEDALSNRQQETISELFGDMTSEQEDAILEAALKKDIPVLIEVAPQALGVELPEGASELFRKFTSALTQKDMALLGEFITDPEVSENLPAMMEAMGQIDPADLASVGESFEKIKPENIPKLEAAFGKLGISIAAFLTNPGSLIKYFSDPVLSLVLVEIQGLLPTFSPQSLNALLKVKNTFDDVDGAGVVMDKALKLPMGLLMKLFRIKLTPEDREVMEQLGGLTDDPKVKILMDLGSELGLLGGDSEALTALAEQCSHDNLRVVCADTAVDLCPNGHYMYGLMTLLPFFQPAIFYAIGEFKFYKAFRFGGLFGKMYGQGWHWLARFALLGLYIIAMIPLFIVLVIVKYYRVLKKIFHQKSASKIQEDLDEVVCMHSLEASGSSFYQVFTQLQFMVLLVVMGGGTIIAGVDAVTFFKNVVPLTIASVIISSIDYVHTMWSVKRLDHRTKDLQEPVSRKWTSLISFLVWIITAEITQVFSIVALSIIAWIEIFSGTLGSTGINLFTPHIIPGIVLQLVFAINVELRRRLLKSEKEDVFNFGHGVLSAVFPTRYLHRTNRSVTKKFLLLSQFAMWACHVLAWLSYSIIVYAQHNEEAGLLRMLPVITALVSLGPALAAVHWALVVNPSYEEHSRLMNGNMDGEEKDSVPAMRKAWLYHIWQVATIITRVTSLVLLFYVYYEHWTEVPGGLAWLFKGPYLLLIVAASAGLQLGTMGRWANVLSTLTAWLVPSGFRRSQPGRAGRYLVLNVSLNLLLHLLLWLSMTFYCWSCSRALDPYFGKLSVCFPVAVGLWMGSLVLTLAVWRLCIRHSLGSAVRETYQAGNGANAWTEKEAAVTTKF